MKIPKTPQRVPATTGPTTTTPTAAQPAKLEPKRTEQKTKSAPSVADVYGADNKTAKLPPQQAASGVQHKPQQGGSEVATLQAQAFGAGVVDDRLRAPWSERAQQIAGAALEHVKAAGLEGDAAVTAAAQLILATPEAKGARISLCIRDLNKPDSSVFTRNPDMALNPASNSKLATASFALGVLGPDHVFETPFKTDAQGNLYVQGCFDPSISSKDLLEVARQIKSSGVDRIDGDIVLDNSRLVGDRTPAHFEEYGDQDWEYLCRPECLSVDRNLLRIEVAPGAQPGQPALASASQSAFELRCAVVTKDAGAQFQVGCDEQDVDGKLIRNTEGQAIVDIWGDIAADYKKGKQLLMKSPDPVASFGDRIAWALAQAGVEFGGTQRSAATPETASTLTVHRSPPLDELLADSIACSNAFDHEMYCLAAASALTKDSVTSVSGAVDQLNSFLADELKLTDFRMENASGIGNANRLSGNDMVDMLANSKADARYGCLLDSLARPGERGTLRTRMLGSDAEGRLRAKTGTLKQAVALSGSAVDVNGSERAFSCLINDYKKGRKGARAVLDALGLVLCAV